MKSLDNGKTFQPKTSKLLQYILFIYKTYSVHNMIHAANHYNSSGLDSLQATGQRTSSYLTKFEVCEKKKSTYKLRFFLNLRLIHVCSEVPEMNITNVFSHNHKNLPILFI